MSQFSEGREWNPTSSKEESEREVKIQISSIEYRLTYARASGSGGQNVNKRDTKAVLHWNIDTSHVFTPEQKELIKERLKNRINKRTGELVLSFDRERTQETNTREVIKLLHHAGADRVERPFEYSRLGTSGGLGIEGGDIVVANRGLEASGKPRYRIHVLGEEVELPTEFDPELAERIFDCRDAVEATVVRGDTVSCDDFYTEQARLDGAFCMVAGEAEKIKFLKKLHANGARNMEMEASAFAAFCKHMGIPAACVGVALLNRLNGDQVKASGEQLAKYSDGPQQLLIEYIKRQACARNN